MLLFLNDMMFFLFGKTLNSALLTERPVQRVAEMNTFFQKIIVNYLTVVACPSANHGHPP